MSQLESDDTKKNKELLKKLKSLTEENYTKLVNDEKIFQEEELSEGHFIENKSFEMDKKVPYPINFIFRIIYDPDTKCQITKERTSFKGFIGEKNKDYDIKFTKTFYDFEKIPNLYKMSYKDSSSFLNRPSKNEEEIKKYFEDFNSYPLVLTYQYDYQHPINNPLPFAPKETTVSDRFKIIFISPICFIVEISGISSGVPMADTFYVAIRYRYDMELNNDFTIKKTMVNSFFGMNFVKSNLLKGIIIGQGVKQAEDEMINFYIPTVLKELGLSMKKYNKGLITFNESEKSETESIPSLRNSNRNINKNNNGDKIDDLIRYLVPAVVGILLILVIFIMLRSISDNFLFCFGVSFLIFFSCQTSEKVENLVEKKGLKNKVKKE